MTKFQAKYDISVDLELTFERAVAKNFSPRMAGGRPMKGGEQSHGQLILPLRNGAKVVLGPKIAQVYWSGDHEDVREIEELLNGLVVLGVGVTKRFDSSTREDVSSDRMYKEQIAEIASSRAELETMVKHRDWKLEVISTLKTSAKIRNGKVSDYLTVNRRYYLEKAQVTLERLMTLLGEGVENGWVVDDHIRTETARLKRIVDSGGRL